MKRAFLCFTILFTLPGTGLSQEQVKNLILMIPDGTSSSVLSLARWYKCGVNTADQCRLAIDPHICGFVTTYNSDSPIGDSAPTGSAYATGYLSNTGFVATYPVSSGKRDLVNVDPGRAYHPLFTILEAAKLQGKATGLVVTSEFTHATPADFAAHTPYRDDEEAIAMQMVHNRLNLVFGGGLQYLDPAKRKDGLDLFNVLRTRKYRLVTTLDQFRALIPADTLVYGLFAEDYLPYDLDRNPDEIPSLAGMTRKAIKILSENPNGFFLMVEGSKIDWAAHTHDPVGIITEFLAFDEAVKEAMDFANRDGYTAVVVVPDHGTSGISLGNLRPGQSSGTLDIHTLINPLRECTMTADGISRMIRSNPFRIQDIILAHTGIWITQEETEEIKTSLQATNESRLTVALANLITCRTYIGFSTYGHTGEDVLLAIYHPAQYRPYGVIPNTQLHAYLTKLLGIPDLDSLTAARFCIDTLVLQGVAWNIQQPESGQARLMITLDGDRHIQAEVEASTDYITLFRKGKPMKIIPLGSLALFVEPLGHFFIPADLLERVGW